MNIYSDPLFVAAEVAWRKESLSGAGTHGAKHRHTSRRPRFGLHRSGHRHTTTPRPA